MIADNHFVLIICLAATYFLFRHIPKRLTTILLYLLPVLAVVQIIYGYNRLTDPWQGLSDITGTFNNTGIFGGFVAMGVVSVLGLMFLAERSIIRIVPGILLIPLVIQLVYSQSRAAWVAAVVGILVLLLPFFRKITKLNAAILISTLLITGILFSNELYHFKKDSADGRLLMWTVSWNMIKEKPLTGFGLNRFQKNYPLWQGAYFKDNPDSPWADLAGDTSSPFNEFLKTGVEQGITGLLFIAGIVFLSFRNFRCSTSFAMGTTDKPVVCSDFVQQAIVTSLIAFSYFSYPFEFVSFQVPGIFCLANIASFQPPIISMVSRHCKSNSPNQYGRNYLKLLLSCLIVITGGLILFASYKYYTDVKKWNHIIYASSSNDYRKIAGMQALYPSLKHNARFVSIYARIMYNAGYYTEAISLSEKSIELFPSSESLLFLGEAYEKTGDYTKAIEAWETASYIKPVLFAPHYNMAKLYFKLKDCERAKQKADEVVRKKMKIVSPEIRRMKREMQLIFTCDN